MNRRYTLTIFFSLLHVALHHAFDFFKLLRDVLLELQLQLFVPSACRARPAQLAARALVRLQEQGLSRRKDHQCA
jgi:hypothetical protein